MRKDKKNKSSKDLKKELIHVAQKIDPLGSYTGKPNDPNDGPEQDADDL